MKPIQVWGVRIVATLPGVVHRQPRVFVGATSRAAAVRAFNAAGLMSITDRYLATYGSESWNETERLWATKNPGVVYAYTEDRDTSDIVAVNL